MLLHHHYHQEDVRTTTLPLPAPRPTPPSLSCPPALHPLLAGWVSSIRNDTGERRSTALADLYELLRGWEAAAAMEAAMGQQQQQGGNQGEGQEGGGRAAAAARAAALERLHKYVRGVVVDELVWLLRWAGRVCWGGCAVGGQA